MNHNSLNPEDKKFAENKIESMLDQSYQMQIKYVYYIMAVNAACVAFIVNITQGLRLSIIEVLLAISVLLFGNSFYYGIKQIQNLEVCINLSIKDWEGYLRQINVPQWVHDDIGIRSKKGNKYRKYQNWSLFAGSIFFVTWHIITLALQS